MKKTAIVTGGTKNQFPAMAVLALNIAKICPNIADELVIFHDGIPIEQQDKVNKIYPTRFIEYKSPFENQDSFSSTVTNYFSSMVFCKYECFRLLDEYSTVIWSDYDILIRKDISYVKTKSAENCKFIKESYLPRKFNTNLYENKFESEIRQIDLNERGISCPLFVLYDDFPNYIRFYDELVSKTVVLAETLYLPEEAILSIILQKWNAVITELSMSEFVTPPSEFEDKRESANIFHAVGQPKFWNGLKCKEWEELYSQWTKEYHGCRFKNHVFVKLLRKIIKNCLPYGIVSLLKLK